MTNPAEILLDVRELQKRYGEDSDMSPNPIFNYDTGVHYQQLAASRAGDGTAFAD